MFNKFDQERNYRGVQEGDFRNFRKVVEKTSPLVFSIALRMLEDEDIARDVVQDTMVTIWQKLAKIRKHRIVSKPGCTELQ